MRKVASAVPILCQGGRASAHCGFQTEETMSFSMIQVLEHTVIKAVVKGHSTHFPHFIQPSGLSKY